MSAVLKNSVCESGAKRSSRGTSCFICERSQSGTVKLVAAYGAPFELVAPYSRVRCVEQDDAVTVCNSQQAAVVRRCGSVDDAVGALAFEHGLVARRCPQVYRFRCSNKQVAIKW